MLNETKEISHSFIQEMHKRIDIKENFQNQKRFEGIKNSKILISCEKVQNCKISEDFDTCFRKNTEKVTNSNETNKISYEQLLKLMSENSSFSEILS